MKYPQHIVIEYLVMVLLSIKTYVLLDKLVDSLIRNRQSEMVAQSYDVPPMEFHSWIIWEPDGIDEQSF